MNDTVDFGKIAYKTADGKELFMYCFYPSDATSANPSVICIHGGGWERESPRILFRHAEYFASRGFVAFCPEYRLMQKGGDIMQCLEDCADAALFVKENAGKLKADPDSINVFGESAGGHLACCLGCRRIFERLRPGRELVASKVIDINGITDLTGYWKYAMPDTEKRYAYSPVHNASVGDAPVFIMHGTDDTVVDTEDSARYAKALASAGVECETEFIENARHAFLLFGFDTAEEKIYSLLDRITDRLKR